jgi:hypothetical protein
VLLVSVSLFRYWMHRWQHSNEFLWKLHSYHLPRHRPESHQRRGLEPSRLRARNISSSCSLASSVFSPLAILVRLHRRQPTAVFSHCGADIKGGVLNYVFMTPEVHRWHHASTFRRGTNIPAITASSSRSGMCCSALSFAARERTGGDAGAHRTSERHWRRGAITSRSCSSRFGLYPSFPVQAHAAFGRGS